MRRSRLVSAIAGGLLVVGALAGCTAAGSSSGGSTAAFQDAKGRVPAPASAAGSVSEQSASAVKAPTVDRSVVTTGSLRLVTDHPVRTAGRVADLVSAAGGTVGRSDENPGERASASLRLRIPAAVFPRTLDTIERQGDVRDVSIRSTDVTAQVTDYTVRIANLRTSIARFKSRLRQSWLPWPSKENIRRIGRCWSRPPDSGSTTVI